MSMIEERVEKLQAFMNKLKMADANHRMFTSYGMDMHVYKWKFPTEDKLIEFVVKAYFNTRQSKHHGINTFWRKRETVINDISNLEISTVYFSGIYQNMITDIDNIMKVDVEDLPDKFVQELGEHAKAKSYHNALSYKDIEPVLDYLINERTV